MADLVFHLAFLYAYSVVLVVSVSTEILVENIKAVDLAGGGVWENGVHNITTEDDLTEEGEEVEFAYKGKLVQLLADEVLTEELLQDDNVGLGCEWDFNVEGDETADDQADEVRGDSTAFEHLAEDECEVKLSNKDRLENVFADDVLLDQLLEQNNVTLGEDNLGVNWVDGVDDITADDNLTENGEEIELSEENGLEDFLADHVLAEEILKDNKILLSGDGGVDGDETVDDLVDELNGKSTAFENLTDEGGEFNLSDEDGLVDLWGDKVLLEEILEDDEIAFGEDNRVGGWHNGVNDLKTGNNFVDEVSANLSADENLAEEGDVVELADEDSLVNFWGDDVQLEELLKEEDIALGDNDRVEDLLSGDWNNGIDNWDNLLVNLNINDLLGK